MKTTQCQRLLNHFKAGKSINRLTALTELGIFELSARIKQLEKEGFCIHRERIEVQNRFKETCRCMRYWMALVPEGELNLGVN